MNATHLQTDSVFGILEHAASDFPGQPAVRRADGARTDTYDALLAKANRGARRLREHDLRDHDRVLLAVEPGPDWPAAFFAILRAGLVAVPIPEETDPRAAAAAAAHARVRAAILSPQTQAIATHLGPCHRIPIANLWPGGSAAAPSRPRVGGACMLAFTSGSTCAPRAVELTHDNLLSNLTALRQVREVGPGDAFLSMLTPAHLFEFMAGLLGPLSSGALIVYCASRLPNRLVESVRQEHITHALAVPALLDAFYLEVRDQLVEQAVVTPQARNWGFAETAQWLTRSENIDRRRRIRDAVRDRIGAAFHTFMVGGAAIDPSWHPLLRFLGIRLEVGYGLTEASPVVTMGNADESPSGSVGRPLPGVRLRISNDGEVLVQGPSVMAGYHEDPVGTRTALEGGWLHTGDRGHLDERGFLFLEGRLKDAFVTESGHTISPDEIEPFYRSPLFREHCVVAIPGPQGNDHLILCVVPFAQTVVDSEIEEAFRDLRAAAPPHLRLGRVHRFSDSLPRTATGKVRKHRIVRALQEGAP